MSAADASGETLRRRGTRGIAHSRQTGLNDALAVLLVIIVALIPVPLGANNAMTWTLSAAIVGALGIGYVVTLQLRDESLRVVPAKYGVEAGLWTVLLAYLVIQVLPLSALGVARTIADTAGNTYSLDQVSVAPGMTLLMAIRLAGYGLFLFLCLQVTANRDRATRLADLMLWVFAAHAVLGLLSLSFFGDTLLIFDKWAYRGVATGTFINRNSFATFLALGMVLGTGLTLRSAMRRRTQDGQRLPRQDEMLVHTALMAVATMMILAALLATQSRMGLFAGLVGVLATVLGAVLKSTHRRLRTALIIAVAGLFLVVVAMAGFGMGTLERLGSVESAADVRFALYRQVWQMIEANWLLGTGGGSFEVAYPLFHRWPVSPDLIWDKAHNTYLSLWSELGLVFGSIPVIVFACLSGRLVVLIVRRSEDWWLPLVAFACLLVVAVHSLVDFSMEIQGVAYALLFMLSLGLDTRGGRAGKTRRSGTET